MKFVRVTRCDELIGENTFDFLLNVESITQIDKYQNRLYRIYTSGSGLPICVKPESANKIFNIIGMTI